MENGTTASPSGVEAAIDHASVAGAMTNGDDLGKAGHKRSVSGSILGSLPFLRSSTKDASPKSPIKDEGEESRPGSESGKRGSSIANALRQSQGRKRKGSLRKTALLGRSFLS